MQHAGSRFLVRVRADSKTENPDPIPNNMSSHNTKIIARRKLKQYGRKILRHVSGYVSREWGAVVPLQNHLPIPVHGMVGPHKIIFIFLAK